MWVVVFLRASRRRQLTQGARGYKGLSTSRAALYQLPI